MATLLLGAVGSALGGALFGAVGATIGQAVGALAGNLLDQALFGGGRREGPRLADLTFQSSAEGMPIPRVYGRVRLAGQVIWATEFEEVRDTTSGGGKGGPRTTTYRYFANVAIAICEGPVTRVGRIFADGVEIDRTQVTLRVHRGTPTQSPDPFILAKEGNDAPAYRGVAYVVFERLPLEPYGNRLPVFNFEVIRSTESLEPLIRAVTLIPGATEFGYATTAVRRDEGNGATLPENTHTRSASTNLIAALDELEGMCPNLTSVALIVAWFGTDLRVGACQLHPGVDQVTKATVGGVWSVAGVTRPSARVVSRHDGHPAYGGTPSDASVLEAIAELKRRGLKVTLVPFVLMDIPATNSLLDPYGGARQAAYPWRGRITCHPAPGRPGSPDKTPAISTDVNTFMGTVRPWDAWVHGSGVAHAKPTEWSLSRMVIHYARLAQIAGGVDAFVIGSEYRGLTTLRSSATNYPFVNRLKTLAGDVKDIVGAGTKVTYAADWSEWFGHQPADGSGDVFFHLDTLWADSAIDAIGIDVYWPLSDWRSGDHADRAEAPADHDLAYLKRRLTAGEGYDWYYASDTDRAAGLRTPIVDGAYQDDWVFRFKDVLNWWSNLHHHRPGGVRQTTATAWVPRSKPIWFTELGCPAIDRGANQPNVFVDPKSAEDGLPHFSDGSRDDLIQRRLLEAHLTTWSPSAPGFDGTLNPISPLYGGRMIDPASIYIWTFDARPYPAFPLYAEVWADGPAWTRGHWINGRLGAVSIEGLIRRLALDHEIAVPQGAGIPGTIDGLVISEPTSLRAILEPLASAFGFLLTDAGTSVRMVPRERVSQATLSLDALVDPLVTGNAEARLERVRGNAGELPTEVTFVFHDPLDDYQRATASARRPGVSAHRVTRFELPIVSDPDRMKAQAEIWLDDIWLARETVRFAIARGPAYFEPGDVVTLATSDGPVHVLIERITDGVARVIEGRQQDAILRRRSAKTPRMVLARAPAIPGPSLVRLLDLPTLGADSEPYRPWLAATAEPWPGALTVWEKAGGETYRSIGTVTKPARLGRVLAPPSPGPVAVIDRVNSLELEMPRVELASVDRAALFAGANLAAMGTPAAGFELLQFETATLIAADRYRLSGLIRGRYGTEDALTRPVPIDAWFILVDDAVIRLPVERDQVGNELSYRITPIGHDVGSAARTDQTHAVGGRALRPLAPVHVRARRQTSGDIALSWIRRTRVGGDSWAVEEVPLGETAEQYRLQVLSGAVVKRTVSVPSPGYLYPLAAQIADHGILPSTLIVRIAQVAPGFGVGVWREVTLTVPA
jgi:hypothetical protein